MMTHELEVSIIAAPLGQMDRRVLSQAWYTALRLAPNAQVSAARSGSTQTAPLRSPHYRIGEAPQTAGHAKELLPAVASSRPRRAAPGCDEVPAATGRARSRALAERIERTFAVVPMCAKRATFSLGRGNARVHIILQTIGERPTLLALCRPEAKTVVSRALAQARLALARRGIGVEVCERTCS